MRYQGGKSRIASKLARKIREMFPQAEEIWEPFCGGGAMTLALAKEGFRVHASDIHPDLIMMWHALAKGDESVFAPVTEEEFKTLKRAPSSGRRGFVRFGGSFGGDFNAGYGRHHHGEGNPERQYVWQDSLRSLMKFGPYMHVIDWFRKDFLETPDAALVYADPPYFGTYAYQGNVFDHVRFWEWVLGRPGPTFVSELTGPEGSEVWSSEYTSLMASNSPATPNAKKIVRTEKLFFFPGSATV